jgi:NAD(P)-dependent dehydrogenase (short-subunit alcohol dehydrogenase family)
MSAPGAVAAGAARRVALVIGAGDATGAAIARRLARDQLTVVCVRRSAAALGELVGSIERQGGRAHAFGCDARDEQQVVELVQRIEAEIGPLDVVVHNIGANVRFDIADTTARVYSKVWEMAALSAFLTGREASKVMVPRGRGTIIFTGATASVRGKEGFAAFSGAKQAKRALAQAMARELGPKGVHVAHVVVDGPIETAFIRGIFGEEQYGKMKASSSMLAPDAIAEAYAFLYNQPRSAWTFEMDLRPWDQSLM